MSTLVLLGLCVPAGCYRGPGTVDTEPSPTAEQVRRVERAATGVASLPSPSLGKERYDFAEQFADGAINSDAEASTPTGRGVLPLRLKFRRYDPPALTVLAGYQYTYTIDIRKGDVLWLAAVKPLKVGRAARATVDISDAGVTTHVFAANLPAADATGYHFVASTVPLARFVGHRIRITFGCEIISDGTGAWVSFPEAGIYAKR